METQICATTQEYFIHIEIINTKYRVNKLTCSVALKGVVAGVRESREEEEGYCVE